MLPLYGGYDLVSSGHRDHFHLLQGSLKQNFPDSPVRMYTYGQPRTGDDNYTYWINDHQAF
ncbi:hypothetical protein PILCRDRAFT_812064 [Piloderma croceum F 1598]|uniref:Fungal lipase-type domain-containing protein n=1 Tax=Piloderma croceum (strain F 1598) TaxID=765440 RepID=A0A0C3BUU8_PILCF|nr:hypothetical protein PILCRDRAFT_812064 [Piloderma croceum F 1598]